jgi:hypothetical protein
MPEFEDNHGENKAGADVTRATGSLPGVDIEIVHRRAVAGDVEQISINLRAAPSFEAFGRAFEAVNPFAFWMRVAQLAWQPWLDAARILALPRAMTPPRGDIRTRSIRLRDAPE